MVTNENLPELNKPKLQLQKKDPNQVTILLMGFTIKPLAI